jgi:ubiquinone/menaquinone biosynthesis C-methylase UbiE
MSRFGQSRLAAQLQEIVSRRREESGLYAEVVALLELPRSGRLLEVGCGSGRQLKVVRGNRPSLELFGLDLSSPAIRNARRNLAGADVDLHVGSIEHTDYDDNYFDLVTCFASMSYWKSLVACFNEIHRILKPGGAARLVEPHRNIDLDRVVRTIRANLADASALRRFLAVNVNRFGLRWGRRLGLQLYAPDEIRRLAAESRFGQVRRVDRVSVQSLPIFMLIEMAKIS